MRLGDRCTVHHRQWRGRDRRRQPRLRAPDRRWKASDAAAGRPRHRNLTALFSSGYSPCIHVRPTPCEPLPLLRSAGTVRPRPAARAGKSASARTLAALDAAASTDAFGRHMSGALMRRWLFGIYADHMGRTRRDESAAADFRLRLALASLRGPRPDSADTARAAAMNDPSAALSAQIQGAISYYLLCPSAGYQPGLQPQRVKTDGAPLAASVASPSSGRLGQ
jgi:hypothetical protein